MLSQHGQKWEKGCFKISKRIMCPECKSFLIEFKHDGGMDVGDKITKFSSNSIQVGLTCPCKKKYIIKRVVHYNIFNVKEEIEKK